MDKEQLRAHYKQLRRELDPIHAIDLSEAIIARAVEAIDWSTVQSIHIYRPYATYREVNTLPLIAYIQTAHPRVAIATWRKTASGHVAHWLHGNPGTTKTVEDHQFSIIIVPMLCFDNQLQRIGFGGGFYDHFIAAQPEAVTYGLCYDAGRVATTYSEPHDVPLDFIITETRTYVR